MSRSPGAAPERQAPAAGERRSAVRGVAWTGVESAAGALVGFLLTPLVVRVAGIEGLGLWGACWSLAHAAGVLDLGIGPSYARFTSRAIATGDAEGLNGTVAAGTGFHLGLACLVAGAALLAGPRGLHFLVPPGPLSSQAPRLLACTLATVLLRMILSAYRGVIAGAQRIDLLGRIGAGASLLEGGLSAACLFAGWGLPGMAMSSLFCAALASAAEGVTAHRLCPRLRVTPFLARRQDWKEMLSFGLRLQATRAAEILAARAPNVALALGPGLAVAGAYDLGARVSGALQIVGTLPLPVVQPLAGRLEALGDRDRLRLLADRATRYVALMVLPCAALVLVDAPALLVAWTGRAAPAGASASARLLALALAVSLLVSPTRLLLRGVGRPGIETTASCLGSLLHLSLAIALAPFLGAAGVAGAALTAAILAAGIVAAGALRWERDLFGGLLRRSLAGPFIAGAAGLIAGLAPRLFATAPAAVLSGRAEALVRLLPEASALLAFTTLVAFLAGGVRWDDLAALRPSGGTP